MWPALTHRSQTYEYGSSEKLKSKLAQQALPWVKQFKASRAGRKALDGLQDLRKSNADLFDGKPMFAGLPDRVLFECWCAHQYHQRRDHPHAILSAKFRQHNTDKARLIGCISQLRPSVQRYATNHPLSADYLFSMALKNVLGIEKQGSGTSAMLDILKDLDTQLKTRPASPQQKPGSPQQDPRSPRRLWIACLDYGEVVWGRKLPPDEARTGLEFALALRFKHFTGGAPTPLDIGNCRWPRPDKPHHKGKPHYKLVARFCNATLGRRIYRNPDTPTIDDQQIEQRLTKLRRDYPDLRYVGWPVRI